MIGLDCHPDTFTAAVVVGPTPAAAQVEKVFNKIANHQLKSWALKNTFPTDLFVLEASGNSFKIVRLLASIERKALVLESRQMGGLKEAHANNDKISAIRIAKAYLAGTAKEVWVPDAKTQERRDWFHAHRKAVMRTTQLRNRLKSYLSDNGVRLDKNWQASDHQKLCDLIRLSAPWSPGQLCVIECLLMDLKNAETQRDSWTKVIAEQVALDPLLLSIVRLCGVADIVAFSLGAVIGDIKRFANPRKLVKYVGLDPAFDHSGEGEWTGGIGGHGRSDLRALLVQSAQSVMRSGHPLAKWGKKLNARKGSLNLVVAAVARKLVVAVWYLMMGKWTPLEELDTQLKRKVRKLVRNIGPEGWKRMNKTRGELQEEVEKNLIKGRTYILDPNKFMPQGPAVQT